MSRPCPRLLLTALRGGAGKTTLTYLLESVIQAAGGVPGVVSTVSIRHPGYEEDNLYTTPESSDLQAMLHRMRQAGATHVAMEVTSHGLDLHRVEACWFDVAAFTNLTQDHLDFHGDMERYWASKKSLFTRLLPLGPKGHCARAVINRDDPRGARLVEEIAGNRPTLTFGLAPDNDIWPDVKRSDLTGLEAVLHTPQGPLAMTSPLVGRHNLENILAATGCGIALDLPLDAIQSGIAATTAVPGRLEPVADPGGRFIYVDYAHTPDALENVLQALDALRQGRIICVFGCGGDRDALKRPLMGRTVAEGASADEMRADLEFLVKLWGVVQERCSNAAVKSLIHEDLSLPLRVLRDLVTSDVEKILIDSKPDFDAMHEFAETFLPPIVPMLEYYQRRRPIFDLHGIEDDISKALDRKISLKSGG